MKIGIGKLIIILFIIIIGIVAGIFYMENAEVDMIIKPLFWRIYPNYNNLIGIEINISNNAPFEQRFNVTIIGYYNPSGPTLLPVSNTTTIIAKPHSSLSKILYLTFNTKGYIIPEFEKMYVIVNGLYGYKKVINNFYDNNLYTLNVSEVFAYLAGISNNQFPTLSITGSFTPTGYFNYSYNLNYFQYNYTNNAAYFIVEFNLLPHLSTSKYLPPGRYNITFSFLNYTRSFNFNVNYNTNVLSFYLISPLSKYYTLTIIIKGHNEYYYGSFDVSLT
ncbi:hypothetical protein [Saccharolobus caldissimus]|uniref:Uncharacterized protein n=1 Tax=Saccharolobus caldissimus TaxID=1702097 RepID=A0AAQ4CNN3_9CREN|nr:hypothetical protein [Saccharolobus caldissimus]BDB97414.1 hypothetical protein SACC_04310 [Saccharolobus caldissimus]